MDSKIRDALKKITDNGKEECESVSDLKDGFDVTITSEEAPAFRSNQKAVWVIEPYNLKRRYQILEFFNFWCDSQIAKDTILIIEESNNKYLKYPLSVEKGAISYNIWDDLINSYGINPDMYSEREHESLVKSEEWKRCEMEVLRDLVAIQLLDKMSKKSPYFKR